MNWDDAPEISIDFTAFGEGEIERLCERHLNDDEAEERRIAIENLVKNASEIVSDKQFHAKILKIYDQLSGISVRIVGKLASGGL